jgi:DNA (cytosine-5)-methyltransferase 1
MPISSDGRDGGKRLNQSFVEWMMGLEEGTVCGNGLTRREEMTLLGNGVVPQQAELALRILLEDVKGTILEEVLKPKGEHNE